MRNDVNDNVEARIVAAARTMFIERGYADASMSDIAVAAGIKRSTLHYYFRTKDRLFQAIFVDIVRDIFPRIQNILTEDRPFMSRLNSVIDEYMSLFRKNPALPQFIIGEIQRDVRHLMGVLDSLEFEGYISTIRERMLLEIRRGELRRVPLCMILLTLYSQMIFPFMTRDLVVTLMLADGESFDGFLFEWKRRIMRQIGYLVLNTDNRAEVERIVDATLGIGNDCSVS